jgi:AcrR family transcriptional regulator
MQDVHELKETTPAETAREAPILDTAKRQQLMEGARRVFLEHGFDGASVGDIVRAAGISKGTLYAYFPSKEKLFETLVFEDKRKQAEAACVIDESDEDIVRVLTKLGTGLLDMLGKPEQVALVRIVIGAAGKFPEIGRAFYDAGPGYGIARVAQYLRKMTEKGVLNVPDAELAARQFLALCKAGCHVQLLLGCMDQPTEQEIDETVKSAVTMFLKAYGV